MRALLRLALAPAVVLAQAPSPSSDSTLDRLLAELRDRHPDLARARAQVKMAEAQVPQAKALPDPTLSIGIQNDGLERWNSGRMEMSWTSLMVTQPLYWPGKRSLREQVAAQGVAAKEAGLDRTRMSLEADLRRAYTGLLLVRAQLRLHKEQDVLLQNAEAAARTRYEVGQAAQFDLLRVQLERSRLRQSMLVLVAEERSFLAEVNRLRVALPDTPLDTPVVLEDLPLPELPDLAKALADADARCPELKAARASEAQADKALELARLERKPDYAISVGAMPRWGFDGSRLETMYQVGISFTLPVWRKSKQMQAVAERQASTASMRGGREGLRLTLQQRTQERITQLEALLDTDRLYREGLLVQSEAAMRATLAQFQAGKATLLQVLEGLNGHLSDHSAFLQTRAQALALGIALDETSPNPSPSLSAHALSVAALPSGAGGMTVVTGPASAPPSAPTASAPMSGM